MSFTKTLLASGGVAAAVLATLLIGSSFEFPPMATVQSGFRGTAMVQVYNPRTVDRLVAANQIPESLPNTGPAGDPAGKVYENVKVLGDLSVGEFTRLMASITEWVAPEQGCAYCHNVENMAEDSIYTKVVARRMLQMTKHINADWKPHVAATGVTCYTCHRGNPVPQNVWFTNPGPRTPGSVPSTGQNLASSVVGLTSLPYDPFTPFLSKAAEIRVEGTTALPTGNRQSIKQTDWTYGLMIHMSTSLGVNCSFCHNTRQFADWKESTPQRVTAWQGIRMVRDLNNTYMESLTSTFPPVRLGQHGDVAKVNCATCHQGVFKPLYGKSELSEFPELAK